MSVGGGAGGGISSSIENAGRSLGCPARRAVGQDPCSALRASGSGTQSALSVSELAGLRGLHTALLRAESFVVGGCLVCHTMFSASLISVRQMPGALPSCDNQNFL